MAGVRIRGRRPTHASVKAAIAATADGLASVPAEGPPSPAQPKPSKFGNVATMVDGIRFASKREAKRYGVLKVLAECGHIQALKLQPRYPLIVRDELVCTYVGDFEYVDEQGVVVTEDVKGHMTDVFRLKQRLFKAVHGYAITITR
jgi:Protein of unknown function (DUF1064)